MQSCFPSLTSDMKICKCGMPAVNLGKVARNCTAGTGPISCGTWHDSRTDHFHCTSCFRGSSSVSIPWQYEWRASSSRRYKARQGWGGNGLLSIVEQVEDVDVFGPDRSAILTEPSVIQGSSVTPYLIRAEESPHRYSAH